MSDKVEKALNAFERGANCCQAAVCAFSGESGMDEATAMRMGAAFGGGMRRGEVCGAVVGALMALGLRYGADKPEDQERKAAANAKTAEFMKTFQERYGSYLCRELIKANGKKICDTAIAGAVALVEEMEA